MIICAGGDIHGAIGQFYEDVLSFERFLAVRFDHVLHVGDFGIWPDPDKIDRGTRNHEGAGDFSIWLKEGREAPRPTVFIKGNHEDFEWLEKERVADKNEVLPGLRYLPNGEVLEIVSGQEKLRVGGVGGCLAPSDYERSSGKLQGYARCHFTHDEVARLCEQTGIDVLLLHNAPGGVEFKWRRPDGSVSRRYFSEAEGLVEVLAKTRPTVCFFGHHHTRLDAEIAGVKCMGLNKVGYPGNLVAVRIEPHQSVYEKLGEWPERLDVAPS